jgi:asparagine synthase (glutamine-hydrolysing)
MPLGYKGRNWLQALGSDLDRSLPLIASYFDRKTRLRLIPGAMLIESTAEQILTGQMPTTSNLLDRATRQDFNNYLAEDILVKVDRASMLNSLEIRAPFLDVDLIDFAFGKVPHEYKATSLDRKILLKRLTAKVLPSSFDRQRKQGFSIPLANWLKAGPFRKLFEQILLDKQCVFDQPVVQKLFLDHDRGCNNSERLFSLLMLELWCKTYAIEF